MSQLEFQPMLTPKEMLEKGIFGGTYFAELIDHRDFPEDWFKKLDEVSTLLEIGSGSGRLSECILTFYNKKLFLQIHLVYSKYLFYFHIITYHCNIPFQIHYCFV